MWCLNFSASPAGGGLKRLVETVRYFDENRIKALFLIHPSSQKHLSSFKFNEITPIKTNKFLRLIYDGYYLKNILKDRTIDCYFSYGIPLLKKRVAQKQWIHLSNALVLEPSKTLPFRRKMELKVLSHLFKKSLRYADVVSAESCFYLNKMKKIAANNQRYYHLVNGVDHELVETAKKAISEDKNRLPYAITVGTYRYKRLDLVYSFFQSIKKDQSLEKLIILGDKSHIPANLLQQVDVECPGNMPALQVYDWLRKAKCFISASEIENFHIAALEAIYLTPKVYLSPIPAHLEILDKIADKDFIVSQKKTTFDFIEVDLKRKNQFDRLWESWDDNVAGQVGFVSHL